LHLAAGAAALPALPRMESSSTLRTSPAATGRAAKAAADGSTINGCPTNWVCCSTAEPAAEARYQMPEKCYYFSSCALFTTVSTEASVNIEP
jgi:hypothetical protein